MAGWNVDRTSEPGVLRLRIEGSPTAAELAEFVTAHNQAIDEYHGRDYRVWCDISRMGALSPECATLLEQAKRYSASRENFRGSSVLVSSAMIALQHRRTSESGGVLDTELISDDPVALRKHLRTVHRGRRR